jgi:hypothetical protein
MRFTTLLYAGVVAVASAQSSAATTTPSATNSATGAQSSQQIAITNCLNACKAGDVDCQSKCIAVPNPDAGDVSAPLSSHDPTFPS